MLCARRSESKCTVITNMRIASMLAPIPEEHAFREDTGGGVLGFFSEEELILAGLDASNDSVAAEHPCDAEIIAGPAQCEQEQQTWAGRIRRAGKTGRRQSGCHAQVLGLAFCRAPRRILACKRLLKPCMALTRWGHPWEGGAGAGVELAIPKGCGATHSQGQVFNFRLLAEDLPWPRTDVRPPRDGNTAGSRRRTKRWEDNKKRQDRRILTSKYSKHEFLACAIVRLSTNKTNTYQK